MVLVNCLPKESVKKQKTPQRTKLVRLLLFSVVLCIADMRLIGDHGGNGHSLKKSRNLPRSAFGATHSNQTDDFSITFTEIDSYVSARQENKTVMITICDKGYLSIFRLFYRINKMEQYSNFIVFVLDKDGYNVHFYTSSHCLDFVF